MKYIFLLFVLFVISGCQEEELTPFTSQRFIKFKFFTHSPGTEYWRYDSDGYGATWDTADDVMEEEAQRFRWELSFSNSSLTHIHIIEITGSESVPKVYTLTTLTETTLAYKDDFGNSYSFTKVD